MGTKFNLGLIAALLIFNFQLLFADDYVHQVFILNEGRFDYNTMVQDIPVSLGVYDPVNQQYTEVDIIEDARFASDLIVEGDYVYVAADSALLKYDATTFDLVASQIVPGIRNIAIWEDKIIVSRGDIDVVTFMPILFDSYLQVYDRSDLSLDYEFTTVNGGPQYATQNIEVLGDKAYVLVNNAYEWGNFKGLVGVLDLPSASYESEMDLGSEGINPDNLMSDGISLYTLNNKDFTGSSISSIDVGSGDISTTVLPNVSSGCGTSALMLDNIWYQETGSTKLFHFDPVTKAVVDSSLWNMNYYGLAVDPVNEYLYASTTDFTSTGDVTIYAANGTVIHNFPVGVSAGNIAFDVRKSTGIRNIDPNIELTLYPNPVTDNLKIELSGLEEDVTYHVTDLTGKVLFNGTLEHNAGSYTIDLSKLNVGTYFFNLVDGQVISSKRIIKQ